MKKWHYVWDVSPFFSHNHSGTSNWPLGFLPARTGGGPSSQGCPEPRCDGPLPDVHSVLTPSTQSLDTIYHLPAKWNSVNQTQHKQTTVSMDIENLCDWRLPIRIFGGSQPILIDLPQQIRMPGSMWKFQQLGTLNFRNSHCVVASSKSETKSQLIILSHLNLEFIYFPKVQVTCFQSFCLLIPFNVWDPDENLNYVKTAHKKPLAKTLIPNYSKLQ